MSREAGAEADMTRQDAHEAVAESGRPIFGLFTWRPVVLDVVTIGALDAAARARLESIRPMSVLIRYYDDWRGPLVDLQRRIDAARKSG